MTKLPKLTKRQQEVLDAINAGATAHFMPYMGSFNSSAYWYLSTDWKRCTRQVDVLIKRKLIKVSGQGQEKIATAIAAVTDLTQSV